ncbi:hypothetical protein [Thalassospira alkalitolerans]
MRQRIRCQVSGRPRGVIAICLSRIALREPASRGQIPAW